jgi:hypothetical protein
MFLVLGWILTLASLFNLFFQGLQRSYFHQDDVIALGVVADWQGWKTILHLNNEHLNITFWPILRFLWLNFGLNFSVYFTVSMFLHLTVLILIFMITYKQTKSFLYSSLPVWGMVINPNWFAVVWWIDGQMFMLATIFALLSYWLILKIKDKPSNFLYFLLYTVSLLPGMSWGVGLAWPTWPLLVFGIDYTKKRFNHLGYVLLSAQITLLGIYKLLIGTNLAVKINPFGVIYFMLVGISNNLIGRWLWPPENKPIRIICLAIALLIIWLSRKNLKKINKNIFFGLLVVLGSFMIYAIPRWSFGIGQAMANYYAYFPLSFLLISVSLFFHHLNLKGIKKNLLISIFLLHIPLSWLGFEHWVSKWVIRPQQTKAYFQQLNNLQPSECLENIYLPEFIIPQKIWHLDYLWPIFKKGPFPDCL